MTDGPSLPPPRYAHTVHVEAPQPKPFSFLLGVALLAFAVPAGLVFAFLRFVAEPPAPMPAEAPAAALAPNPEAPSSVVFVLDAGPAAAPAVAEAPTEEPDAGAALAADAAPPVTDAAPLAVDAALAPAAAAPPVPVTFELGMGILHSCRNATGKYLEGYQDCGSAGELDRYLSKVIGQVLVACDQNVPASAATVRANVDFGVPAGHLDVVDWKMTPVESPWASCVASHFNVEGLAKIRHNHPKYTLTYRVIPHRPGEASAPR